MRVVIAVFAATLLLTGCKKVVGPAPEAPTGAEAPAAAPAVTDAAALDAAAPAASTGDVTGDRTGTGDRGNRGNDDREGDVVPAAPKG